MKEDIARTILGYAASVLTAAAVTVSIVTAGEAVSLGNFLFILLFGSAYIATCGLPGFAATVWLSRRFGIRRCPFFALAGGANAIIAWTALDVVTGSGVCIDDALFAASVAGGVAGGISFWSVAIRKVRSTPQAA